MPGCDRRHPSSGPCRSSRRSRPSPGPGVVVVVNSSGPASCVASVWLRIRLPSRAEDAHVVAVLVEGMLPATLTDDPQQHLLARMHVRIAVVGLVRVLDRVVRIHVIGHRAPVDHEVRRVVGLGRDVAGCSRPRRPCSCPLPRPAPAPGCGCWDPSPRTGTDIRGRSRSWRGRRRTCARRKSFSPPVRPRRSRLLRHRRWSRTQWARSSGSTMIAPYRPISTCRSPCVPL